MNTSERGGPGGGRRAPEGPGCPGDLPPGPFGIWTYWRVWRRFVALAVARLLEYRISLLFSLVDNAAQLGLLAVVYLVFYGYTDEVAGWSRADALVLLGVYWIFDGVWSFQLAGNLARLSHLIHNGELDFLLLRPVPSPFLVACWRGVDIQQISKIAQGLMLTACAGQSAGVTWSLQNVLVAVLFGLCGLTLLYALRFIIATGTFWVMQTESLYELFYSLFYAARFPVTYFREPVRGLLTYVVPVAFATTFPAQALLGRADYHFLPMGLLLSIAALIAATRFWYFAIRAYSSASS